MRAALSDGTAHLLDSLTYMRDLYVQHISAPAITIIINLQLCKFVFLLDITPENLQYSSKTGLTKQLSSRIQRVAVRSM